MLRWNTVEGAYKYEFAVTDAAGNEYGYVSTDSKTGKYVFRYASMGWASAMPSYDVTNLAGQYAYCLLYTSDHFSLTLCHIFSHDQFGQSIVLDLAVNKELWFNTCYFTACIQHTVGNCTHQPGFGTAVDPVSYTHLDV